MVEIRNTCHVTFHGCCVQDEDMQDEGMMQAASDDDDGEVEEDRKADTYETVSIGRT